MCVQTDYLKEHFYTLVALPDLLRSVTSYQEMILIFDCGSLILRDIAEQN